MDVLSYRGPGAAGGVSSGLERAWRTQHEGGACWWFLSGDFLNKLPSDYQNSQFVTMLSENLVKGHYRFCNEFIWPIMHDLPEYATLNDEDRELYRQFNLKVADHVTYESGNRLYFVQDYQLALVPRYTKLYGARTHVFWHIPWPKAVPAEFVQPVVEIARALLRADGIAFHTQEYVDNFMHFIWQYLPEFVVDQETGVVRHLEETTLEPMERRNAPGTMDDGTYVLARQRPVIQAPVGNTRLFARPLGIDMEFWRELSSHPDTDKAPAVLKDLETPFVLSVDRADYTKAVADRIASIDEYFTLHPERVGELTFVQICGRTRSGLEAFDQYWEVCQAGVDYLNARWAKDGWEPLRWVKTPLGPPELAQLYRSAVAMLVNPVRDGLNLTAKEYVACQGDNAGVLLLSEGAGVWKEFGGYALPASPAVPGQISESLETALSMSQIERNTRMQLMKQKVEKNSLSRWWMKSLSAFATTEREHAITIADERIA